jgi:hypothetical protein
MPERVMKAAWQQPSGIGSSCRYEPPDHPDLATQALRATPAPSTPSPAPRHAHVLPTLARGWVPPAIMCRIPMCVQCHA